MSPFPDSPEPSNFTVEPGVPDAAHQALNHLRRHFSFDDDDVGSEHLVAFSEIIQNAIDAHQRDGVDRPIDVTMTPDPPSWSVLDHAAGFDVAELFIKPLPPPTATSGRGLLIASAFVPSMRIESGATGTSVHLPVTGARWTPPIDD